MRGVKFFSGPRSKVLRGPSTKTYQFFRDQDSAPVLDPRDIQFFRSRDDVFEEGTPSDLIDGTRNRKQHKQPRSYRRCGRANIDPALLAPPSKEKLQEAEERRLLYSRQSKERADTISAAATAEVGIGTKRAQLERKANADKAAGRDRVENNPTPPPTSVMTPVSVDGRAVADAVDNSAAFPVTEKVETVPATETTEVASKPALKFKCKFCGKGFKAAQGVNIHEKRFCKKNPDATG